MHGYVVVVFRVVSWLFSCRLVLGDVVDTNESLIIIIIIISLSPSLSLSLPLSLFLSLSRFVSLSFSVSFSLSQFRLVMATGDTE